ncbi:MAG: hypothetical protein EOP41_07485, partial [Sphingobacteriaceae bacterium]
METVFPHSLVVYICSPMKLPLLFALSLLLLASCSPAKKEQPVSKQEATTFAKTIESGIKKKDYTTLDNVMDIDLFAEEMMKAADIKKKSSFKEGVKQEWNKVKFSAEIIKSLGTNGTYQFVKAYEKGGHQHIVFRLYGDGGLNYHDFELVKYTNKVMAKDIFIYITGEPLSKTMAQVYSTALQEASANGDAALSQYSKALIAMRRYYSQKEYQAAKEEFDRLPESLQNEKAIQLIYLQVASSIGGDVHQQALDHFEKLFGNDPSAQLALFDVFFLKGDYDKVLQIIDKMDAELQDPFLNTLRR